LINKYRPETEQKASSALNAVVELGEIDVTVFPSPRIKISEVSVSRHKNTEEKFTVNDFLVAAELLPLFTGNLKVTTVAIDSPSIRLIKDRDGVRLAGLPPKETVDKTPAPPTVRDST